jgi:hypothetical protein
MLGAAIGILAEVGRGEIREPVADCLPSLYVRRIATGTSCAAKIRIALLDLPLGGAILRCRYRSKSAQQHDRCGSSNNTIHSTSMRVVK